jgi:hypothetical protein
MMMCVWDNPRLSELLWTEVADDNIREDKWASEDTCLRDEYELPWHQLNPDKWGIENPICSDFARHQALSKSMSWSPYHWVCLSTNS